MLRIGCRYPLDPSPQMSEWISVEDKFPEDNQELLMTYNDLVMQGIFSNKKFYHPSVCAHVEGYCNCEEQEGISHWMPLPEPPNAGVGYET